MKYQFTVSPDFTPDHISGWYIFNTWLQRRLNESTHLELYDDFESQRQVIAQDGIDLIYSNPYDATMLVRDKGFRPIARAGGKSDEAVMVVREDHPAQRVEDLAPGLRIASTDDPDINLIGVILLEPADLNHGNTTSNAYPSYPIVAKNVISGNADVGLFLDEAYDSLSRITRSSLRVLVRSEIHVIHHVLMAGPRLADKVDEIRDLLVRMPEIEKGPSVLESLGFDSWQPVDEEETEFMIDLMETLSWQPT
jgi:phosphonate transport system substrate-binding protein